jgi:hypothetical protein
VSRCVTWQARLEYIATCGVVNSSRCYLLSKIIEGVHGFPRAYIPAISTCPTRLVTFISNDRARGPPMTDRTQAHSPASCYWLPRIASLLPRTSTQNKCFDTRPSPCYFDLRLLITNYFSRKGALMFLNCYIRWYKQKSTPRIGIHN